MIEAIIVIRNDEERTLSKAAYLGGNLLLHAINEVKKLEELEKIYIVGADYEVPGTYKADNIKEIINATNDDDQILIFSPLFPEIRHDDLKRLCQNDCPAFLSSKGVICEAFVFPKNKVNELKDIEFINVENNNKSIKKIVSSDLKKTAVNNIDDFVVFALSSSKGLVEEVCHYLNIKPGKIMVNHFADGETLVELGESVRGKRIYVIQSTSKPVNEHLMELLICVDALKRSSAAEITCIIPYFGYARQDRKAQPRQPITAKLAAKMLETAGADRVVTMDLHAAQIQGFFDCPVDDLTTVPMMGQYFRRKNFDPNNIVVVSPDHGGVKRARTLAEMLGCPIAIIDKRRPHANVCEALNIIGDVEGKDVIVVDDICDTGGSLIAASKILKDFGCNDVYVCIAHGLFSNDACSKIQNSDIKEVVVTNTIAVEEEELKKTDKIKTLSVGWMLSKLILAVSCHTPVSEVYALYED